MTEAVKMQLSDLHIELKRLSSKFDTSSSSVMSGPARSVTPEGRRVSFDDIRRDPSPGRHQSTFNRRGDDIPSRMQREAATYTPRQEGPIRNVRGQDDRTSIAPTTSCDRCGSRNCTAQNPLYCRFSKMRCYFCNRVGHAQQICVQRLRGQNRQY